MKLCEICGSEIPQDESTGEVNDFFCSDYCADAYLMSWE